MAGLPGINVSLATPLLFLVRTYLKRMEGCDQGGGDVTLKTGWKICHQLNKNLPSGS